MPLSMRAPRAPRRVTVAVAVAVLVAVSVAVGCATTPGARAGVTAVVGGLPTTGGELLANGSFESALPAPTRYSAITSLKRVSGNAESGSFYERIAATTNILGAVGVVNRPALSSKGVGTNLTASCYVRSNGIFPVILRLSEVSGGSHLIKERLATASRTWEPISLTYTVATARSRIFVGIYSTGPTLVNAGAIAVDGCSLMQVRGPLPVVGAPPVMPSAAPSGFTRLFSEDFNTPAALDSFDKVYGSRFSEYSGCCTTNKSTRYSSSKVLYARNGSMFFNLHSENGTSYAAAPVPDNYLNFKYGQVGVAVRLASSVGDGWKLAFLLWPETDEWTNEIDFAEVYPDFAQPVYATSLETRVPGSSGHLFRGGPTRTSGVSLADNNYHTVLLDWRPGKVVVTIDGTVAATFTGNAAPAQAMHVVMQTEGWTNHGVVPAASSATLEVPWIYINGYN